MQKESIKKIAEERIRILFNQAAKALKEGEIERSKKYIKLAKKIGMKAQVAIPKDLKRKFCKKCYALLIGGQTARIRIKKKKKYVTYTCLSCGNVQRYPFLKERKALKG